MFVSYATTPFPFSYHHATLRERVHAARYASEEEARRIVAEYTNVSEANGNLFRHAVAVVIESAKDIKEARCDSGGECPYDYVWDGWSVEETLAQRAIDSLNETLFEAMVS